MLVPKLLQHAEQTQDMIHQLFFVFTGGLVLYLGASAWHACACHLITSSSAGLAPAMLLVSILLSDLYQLKFCFVNECGGWIDMLLIR